MTLDAFSGLYGKILDDVELDVDELCQWLAIPNVYGDIDDFSKRYLFDENDPNSIISNMGRAFDNAIVLRDVIRSQTLAYVQLAYDTLESGATSASPMLEVQQTVDYLYAFWGALGDFVDDPRMRNTVRLGASVERVDLALRLGLGSRRVSQEVARLADRLYRSQLDYDGAAFQRLLEAAESGQLHRPCARGRGRCGAACGAVGYAKLLHGSKEGRRLGRCHENATIHKHLRA